MAAVLDYAVVHFTTGEIVALIGFLSTIGALWRFTIKPIFDRQAKLEDWRRDVHTRITLIEESLPADKQAELARLRERLTEN